MTLVQSSGRAATSGKALSRRAPRAAMFMHTCHGTCAPEHTMPDLASVVPAPRFAATMGHGFIKIWNRDVFFWKNHPAKILQWAPRESLSQGKRNAPPDGHKKYLIRRSVPSQIFKILFRGFYSLGFDPPHKIMRYWFYCSTQLAFSFQDDKNARKDMFSTPLRRGWRQTMIVQFFGTILWYKN